MVEHEDEVFVPKVTVTQLTVEIPSIGATDGERAMKHYNTDGRMPRKVREFNRKFIDEFLAAPPMGSDDRWRISVDVETGTSMWGKTAGIEWDGERLTNTLQEEADLLNKWVGDNGLIASAGETLPSAGITQHVESAKE